jgi:hypothetical protein
LPKLKGIELVQAALKAGIITETEAANLKKAEEMRLDAITVDDFSQDEYHGRVSPAVAQTAKTA